MKLRSYPARYQGVITDLESLKQALGWVPSPAFDAIRPQYPFGPIGVGRTNLIADVPLNGVVTGPEINGIGELVSTGILAPGHYKFDFAFAFLGSTVFDLRVHIFDKLGATVNNIPFEYAPQGYFHTINLPIRTGQGVRVQRISTDGSFQGATIAWTYLSTYRTNEPLSIAQRRVQETEAATPGITTQVPGIERSSSLIEPYPSPITEGGDGAGDGGGDSG